MAKDNYNVGTTINEGVAEGASSYREPAKRNIGLLGQFLRGVPFVPTKITSLEQFKEIFGGYSSSFYGPAVVENLFNEAGDADVTLYLARAVSTSPATLSTAATVTANIGTATARTMTLTAGYKGVEDPGAWANGVKGELYSFGYYERGMFTLLVTYGTKKETYSYATLGEIQSAVNRVSKYVIADFSGELAQGEFTSLGAGTVTLYGATVSSDTAIFTGLSAGDVLYDGSTTKKIIGTIRSVSTDGKSVTLGAGSPFAYTGTVHKRNDIIYTATLAGGADTEVVEADFYPEEIGTVFDVPTGLKCFDGYDIQILGYTEYHSISMAKQLNAYLSAWASPIGVFNFPINADEGTTELFALSLQTSEKSFVAGYLGWVEITNTNGDNVVIPAIGAILGAGYLRTPYLSNDLIHIPPAGTDSLFSTVVKVIPARLSQSAIDTIVKQNTCNILQYIENTGWYIGSSRTYSTNELYMSVHIRIQTSYYVRALFAKMRYLEQKPNTPELKREGLVDLRTYFKTEYDNGALERSVDFSVSYKGICDKSNNPSTQNRKLLNFTVLWIPTEVTEAVVINLQRNDGVLTVTEE